LDPGVQENVTVKKWVRGAAGFLGLLVLPLAGLVLMAQMCGIPSRSLTANRMHGMKRRVIRFAEAHGHLPATVDELPELQGFDNSVRDGWWRKITMSVDGNRVTFTSLGRDNKPGGAGEDADMIAVFDARREDGTWQEELVEWVRDPFKQQ
jgi:hypothetical protein